MRVHLAAVAALAAVCLLGSSRSALPTLFEDDVPAHEWSASEHKLRDATEADRRRASLGSHLKKKYDEEIERIEVDLSRECERFPECVHMDNPLVSSCDSGWTSMGYDESGCGTRDGRKYAKPICCRTKVAPKSCVWRKNQSPSGLASDCNGRCNTGEVFLFDSGTGGYPTDSDEEQCGRGYKAFCCTFQLFQNHHKPL
ncbi:hypothetical protein MAPG_06068 [Magnaporthiopsis poae ATCC 64411]|uniref:Uncharacterized protein n=1 Tax=Magnaporthiopsis poae (strain ATCC 64411 / 73-15) TaxID=644358 RepID=A0A0C4E125_MAGP6|nr:hypothetical protein MAPG_06068 [Magnaporthiopsis poae ATCC 64411]